MKGKGTFLRGGEESVWERENQDIDVSRAC